MQRPHFYGDFPFSVVRKSRTSLSFRPQRRCYTLLFLDFTHSGDFFRFTECHAIRADTFAGKVKVAPQIWQIHTPATRFTWRRSTIEAGTAFVTN